MIESLKKQLETPFFALFLCVFALVFSSFHLYGAPHSNGNVEQWVNLTNQMFYGNQDFLFSYGPLFWITGGASSQYNLISHWSMILFLSGFYAVFWTVVVWMANRTGSLLYLALIFVLLFQSLKFSSVLYLWPFILVVYLDLYYPKRISNQKYFFYGAVIALAFYIRFFYGVVGLATLGTYFFSIAVINKNLRGIIFFLIGLISSYLVIGLCIFHNYTSIINYLIINKQLSFGNSVDMTLDVINKYETWIIVAICSFTLILYTFIRKRRLFLTVIALILLFFKLGFSRTDHYVSYFVCSLAIITLLPLFDRSLLGRSVTIICIISLFYLAIFQSYPGAPVKNVFQSSTNFEVDYTDRIQEVYSDFKLSPELLNYIGNKSIDIYPYNNEYAFANKLNYIHRPNFQSYMTLTPKLDSMNQSFFESSGRPDLILWTAGISCNSLDCNPFDSFDQKYTLNEDPLTTNSIFLNYHKVANFQDMNGKPLILLEKNKSVFKSSEILIKNEELEFGKWYDVPKIESGLLKIKPNFEMSTYGKIKNMLFRGSILKIKYELSTGEIKEYRVNILNSQSGITISPLLDNFNLSGLSVTKIKFINNDKHYFEPVFNVTWVVFPQISTTITSPFDTVSDSPPKFLQQKKVSCEGNIDQINGKAMADSIIDVSGIFSVNGWLAYSTKSGELYDKIFVVITDSNDKKKFISTRKVNRLDVSNAFNKENLKKSGFTSIIDTSILDGKSKLGLAAVQNSVLYMCDIGQDLNPVK